MRYAQGLFTNVATSANYSVADSTQDLQPLIFLAVARIISQQPALSAIFLDHDGSKAKARYVQIPRIDLRECVLFVNQEPGSKKKDESRNPEWDQLLEEYHNTRFDERWGELPLWRLVISRQPENKLEFIACFFHLHGICDGNSGPAFHRAFLAELQALSEQKLADTFDPVVFPPDSMLPLNVEALHRLPVSPQYLLKLAWQDAFPVKAKNVWLGAPMSAKLSRSRFRSMTLPADVTRRLVAVSRSHSASLTATVHSLVGTAIFANLPNHDATKLKTGIAVNFRRFLPRDVVDDDSIGNWVYVAYDVMKRPSSTANVSWENAQHVKKLLDDEVGRKGKNTPMACLRYVDMHKYLQGRFKRPREGSYLMSNLGVFQPRDGNAGPWKIGRMIFSEGFDISGEALDITMITGCDGCLTVGFVWSDTVTEERFVSGVFDTLEKLLIETSRDLQT